MSCFIAEIFFSNASSKVFSGRGPNERKDTTTIANSGPVRGRKKDCCIKRSCVLLGGKKNGAAAVLASTFGRKPQHVEGQGRKDGRC